LKRGEAIEKQVKTPNQTYWRHTVKKLHYTIVLVALLAIFSDWNTTPASAAETIDFSKKESWLAYDITPDKPVDVFFVYPTVWTKDEPNMDITDKAAQKKAQFTITSQASVFADDANIYAPYYRQISFKFTTYDSHTKYFTIGYRDVETAFDYFLVNISKGRPFILAGHSQGSMMLLRLLKERLHDDALRKRMVMAYVIGWSISKGETVNYPWIKISQRADDTGTVITYNTQGANASLGSPVLLPGAISVNPLTWTADSAEVPASANKGARIYSEDGKYALIKNFAGARADNKLDGKRGASGALNPIFTSADTPGVDPTWGPYYGVYHRYDYAFWYENIKANVGTRIRAYLGKP